MLARIQGCELAQAPLLKPKAIVVAIGTNNLGAGCTWQHAWAGLNATVAALRRVRPHAKLVLLGLLPRAPRGVGASLRADKNYYVRRLERFNAAVRELAAADPTHIHYLDAWHMFIAVKNSEPFIEEAKMPDLLHPSHVGMRAWGLEVRRQVSQLLLA